VKKGEGDQVTTEIVLFERIKAPLKAGDKVGELIALKDGAEVGRYPLVADGDVEVAKLHEIYIRMLKTLI
jgi:D-alanyl-D-alanine carboxypeptidase (penicillin-binding protein 5/6)